jgi:hypothetical protein
MAMTFVQHGKYNKLKGTFSLLYLREENVFP